MSTVENNNKIFRCDKCNKNYKDKSGLWYHNNKYHGNKCIHNGIQNSNIGNKNVDNKNQQNNKLAEIFCKICNKKLSNRQSRWRHEKVCEQNNTNKFIKESDYNELKKENAEIKSILMELLKSSKVHPKTLQKINKNLVTGNNNSTINTGTINNVQIVKFGSDDTKSILSDKEIKKILNYKYKAIEESIKTVHFNDDRSGSSNHKALASAKDAPEYRNIYITNLRDNIAYVYNGNKFEAVQKHSVINQLIDQHMNNIDVSYDDYKNKLSEKTVSILDKLIEKIQDDHTAMTDEENNKDFKNYKLFKINEVKLMIYNETGNNTEVIKLKYNDSMLNKNKEINV